MIQITGGKYLIEPAQQAVSFAPFFAQAKEGSARRTPSGFHASHQFLAHRARPSLISARLKITKKTRRFLRS